MSGHDSDALGTAGEAAFNDLCSRAKLIVTKTDLDRCGWDFRVEWRTPNNTPITDNSPPRRAALVQVKSVFSGSGKFSVRMGAANDLVKTVEPSFFIVLVFSQDLDLLEVHGAPTVGPIASEILRSIRQFVAKGKDARNRSKHLGIAKWTDSIAADPKALSKYLSDHIGSDLREYSDIGSKFSRGREILKRSSKADINSPDIGRSPKKASATSSAKSKLRRPVSIARMRFPGSTMPRG